MRDVIWRSTTIFVRQSVEYLTVSNGLESSEGPYMFDKLMQSTKRIERQCVNARFVLVAH